VPRRWRHVFDRAKLSNGRHRSSSLNRRRRASASALSCKRSVSFFIR
jgi:hypothetical protein